ncbi:STAS domain-containing protein [Umezawaea beigongshangensis]|uniref:STAS domain-containing protein n=1 Tax=Umezawaea beigongshangensis TaxID=2780383 RepID=UPI0018F20036|nr:STAS domain-containing protein [Umezawaea beigongshangensis]
MSSELIVQIMPAVRIDRQVAGLLVLLSGELEVDTAHDLAERLELVRHHREVAVDLSGLTFMSAYGAATLAVAAAEVRARGGRLLVVNANSIVQRVLGLTHPDLLAPPEVTRAWRRLRAV